MLELIAYRFIKSRSGFVSTECIFLKHGQIAPDEYEVAVLPENEKERAIFFKKLINKAKLMSPKHKKV